MSDAVQTPILALPPSAGRFLTLGLRPAADARRLLARLAEERIDDGAAVGLGAPLLAAAGGAIAALRTFPAMAGRGVTIPSTQGALWIFFGGSDGGHVLQRARGVLARLGPDVRVDEEVATFLYGGGRDLTGYEDGTENPKEVRARAAAVVAGAGAGLDGSSFVAAQRWVHDLAWFEALPPGERDAIIGRHHATNEEIGDAPASAHVKRAAQESYEPAAFMVRRSMPFGTAGGEHGLYFVAYGATLDPFEHVLRRMVGLEDGVVDGLLRFSRPVTGGYYWCPPLRDDGRLDLRAIRT
jgi:putative iron-dependent peroxidase